MVRVFDHGNAKIFQKHPKDFPCKFRNHLHVGPCCETQYKVIKDFVEIPYHGNTL
jgi:hypothetical protein